MSDSFEKFYEELRQGTLNDLPGQLDRMVDYYLDRCTLDGAEAVREFYARSVGIVIQELVKFSNFLVFESNNLTPPEIFNAYRSTHAAVNMMSMVIRASAESIIHYRHDFTITVQNAVIVTKHLRKIEKEYYM